MALTSFCRTIAALGGLNPLGRCGRGLLRGGLALGVTRPHVGKDRPIHVRGDPVSLRVDPIGPGMGTSLGRPGVINVVDDFVQQVRLVAQVSIEIPSSGARVAYLSRGQERVNLQLPDVTHPVAGVGSRVTSLGDGVTLLGNPVALALRLSFVVADLTVRHGPPIIAQPPPSPVHSP